MLVALEAAGADLEATASREGCPLEIRLATIIASWIKLGGADAVGVTTAL
jgi:hypothetical protein